MADATVTPRIPLQTPMFDDAGNLTRPWILFFEQFGTPGADGAAGEPAVPPENVTFVSLVKATALDDQGNTYLHVTATYNPPTPDIGTFTGVHTYVEAPDQAIHDPADPRPDPIIVDVGEQQYLGDPAGTVVAPGYTRYGVIEYDFYPTKIEDWRFYLVPFSQFVENKLVPEQDPPDPDATPNKVISVAPGAVVPPGTEIPGNLIPIGVPPQPFLITVAVSDPDGNGLRRQVFTITYDPPDPVPPFTGVAVDIQTPGQVAAGEAFAAGNQEYSGDQTAVYPAVERRGSFQLNLEFAQHGGEHWTFYLSPYSATYRIPLDANKGAYVGTTANRSIIALSDAEGAPGIEWADQVLGLAVTVEYEYQAMVPGWKWRLNGTWTNPDDVRFGGSKQVIREYPAPTPDPSSEDRIPSYFGPQDDTYTTDWYDLADPQTFWDNFQVSIDILQRENSILVTDPAIPPASRVIPPDCPCVRVEVSEVLAIASLGLTRREGEEYASNVTGVSVLVHQVWDDIKGLWTYFITCKWTNPDPAVDPRFGGLDLVYRADGTEDIITPIFYQVDPGVPAGEQTVDLGLGDEWESPADDVPFTMFFRSFDFGGQDNSIVDGVTPAVDAIAFKSPAVGLITGFTMRVEYGDNGAVLINDPTFTPPADPAHPGEVDPSFWYAELWMRNPRWTGQLSEMGQSHDLAIIGENFPPGPASETWDYWGVSVSYDLRKNPDPFNPAVVTGTNHTTQIVGPAPEVGAPAPPGDVDFIDIAQNTTPLFDDQNNEYILVTIRYNPPNPIGTFTGVSVDVEAPDGSRIVVPDGDWDYFGDPAGTVIAPDYTRYGVVKLTFYPANDEDWRFYLSSYSPYVRNGLVFAVTPNLPLPVLAGSTAITPASPANVTFKTITQEVLVDANKDSYLHVVIQYDPPTPIGTFVGVDVDVEAPDQPTQPISKRVIVPIHGFDYNGNPTAGAGTISRMGTIDLTFYPAHHEFWRFYLSSYSSVVHNALVVYKEPTEDHDVTPFGLIEVFPAPIAAPAPAGYVNFISISSETLTDDEKNPYTHITIVYDQPTPVGTFMGVDVNVEAPDLSKIIIDVGSFDYSVHVVSGHGQIDLTFYPTKVETWRFYLTSYSSLVHNALILHGNMGETPNKPIPVSPGALPPGNITFPSTGAITQVTKTDLQHNDYIEVTILYIRPVPVGTFLGVDVDVEAPVNSKIIVPEGGWDYANNVDSSGQGKIILTFYPSKNETWQFYLSSYSMWVHNPLVMQGQPNPSPNIALTVSTAAVAPPELAALPALPSVVSGAQPGPAFRQQGLSNFMETKITATITFPNASHGATGVTIWISFDDGTTYEEAVNDKVGPGTSSNIDFWWTAPLTTNTKVRLKAVSWSPAGWNNPTSAVPSNPFTVNAPTPLTGSIITDAQQVGVITYAKAVDGSYRWGFKATWTNPPASNANFWTTNAYLRKVDGSGNPAPDSEGELREIQEFDVPGVLCTLAVSDTWGIPATPYVYRVYLKCADKLGVETPQNAWPTGAGWLQLNPVEQVGTTGIEYAPQVTGPPTATVQYTNDETGAQIYYLSGSFTPSSDPLYAGCSIMGALVGNLEELNNIPRSVTASVVSWRSVSRPVPAAPETWTVSFLSYNGDGRTNTAGPTATVTVSRQTFGVGTEYASNITAFTVTSNAPVISYTEAGDQQYHWTGTWQNTPADVKRKGVRIIARTPAPTGLGITNTGVPTFTWSSGDQFTADMVGKTITLDPASTPLTLNIIGYTSPTVITLSANGTAFQAHNFIVNGMAADEELYLATEAETSFTSPDKPLAFAAKSFTIYAVSIDASNRQNTIVTGVGGTPVANSGNPIIVTRLVGAAGIEYANAVTSPSASPIASYTEGGQQVYHWAGSWTLPNPVDPRYKGVRIIARAANFTIGVTVTNGSAAVAWQNLAFFSYDMQGKLITINNVAYTIASYIDPKNITVTPVYSSSPGTSVQSATVTTAEDEELYVATESETSFVSLDKPISFTAGGEGFIIYFVSIDANNRQNTIANSPHVPSSGVITITRIGAGNPGREFCDMIINPTLDGTTPIVYPTAEFGEEMWFGQGTFTEPTDPRYGGCNVMRLNSGAPNQSIFMNDVPRSSAAGGGVVGWRGAMQPKLGTPATYVFFSYDTNHRTNLYSTNPQTPQIAINPAAQSASINLVYVKPGSLNASAFANTIAPVAVIANPELPTYATGAGTNYPVGTFAVNSTTGDLRQANSSGGWSPAVDGARDIIARSIIGGTIAVGAITATELVAGEIQVGYGGGKPTRFTVVDSSSSIVGFIGDNGSYQGAYFINLRVGTNINNPFFYAASTGVAMGPNLSSKTNFNCTASGIQINDIPVTIDNGQGLIVNTNSLSTAINNQAFGTALGYWGYVVTDGLNGVGISSTQQFMMKRETSGVYNGRNRSRIAFDANGCQILLYDTNPASGSDPSFPQVKFSVEGSSVGNSPVIKVFDGASLQQGQQARISYTNNVGAQAHMIFVAGVMTSWGSGALSEAEILAGNEEPQNWTSLMEKRLAELEALVADLKGRKN